MRSLVSWFRSHAKDEFHEDDDDDDMAIITHQGLCGEEGGSKGYGEGRRGPKSESFRGEEGGIVQAGGLFAAESPSVPQNWLSMAMQPPIPLGHCFTANTAGEVLEAPMFSIPSLSSPLPPETSAHPLPQPPRGVPVVMLPEFIVSKAVKYSRGAQLNRFGGLQQSCFTAGGGLAEQEEEMGMISGGGPGPAAHWLSEPMISGNPQRPLSSANGAPSRQASHQQGVPDHQVKL